MTALLRKETEALAGFWLAFAVLAGMNLLSLLWEPDFVVEALGERFSNGVENAGIIWFLAFLVGHGAVAHELRDGHIEFLDGLPVSRGSVYAAKVLAASAPIVALTAASFAMDLVQSTLSRPPGALSPVVPLAVEHGVMLCCGIAGLGLGMLLSWLGPLAWGVLGLGVVIATCAGLFFPPVAGWVPLVGSLGELEWQGTTARHPAAPPLVLAAFGVAAMVVSGWLFGGPGRALTDRGSDAIAVVRAGALGCLGLLVLPTAALFALGLVIQFGGELWGGAATATSAGGAFRVLYAPSATADAVRIAASVDDVSRQVGGVLGQHAALRLDIELLGAPEHHLGVYTGGKIRLAEQADDATLAHELAHAHAFTLSGPGAWAQSGGTHFFDEGLADWVQATVAREDPIPPVVGAIAATGQARFEDLVDRERHLARHDIRQAYALGAVFVDALVGVGGREVLPCVLRGIGDAGERPVAPLALWYGLAARCGFDLDAVEDRYVATLAAARDRLGEPLPRLRASVLPDPPRLLIRDELGLGATLRCGFRDDPDTPVDRWIYDTADGDGVCAIPIEGSSGHTVQYQVGFRLPGAPVGDDGTLWDVYLEWTDARR